MISTEQVIGLLRDNRLFDVYKLARYFYREGIPIIDDPFYEKVESAIIQTGELSEYVNRVYDEDPVPLELLDEFGVIPLYSDGASGKDNPYYDRLVSEAAHSIRAVTEYEELWEFCKANRNKDLTASIKVNGVYIGNAIDEGENQLSLTRGRGGADPWDATYAMRLITGEAPRKVPGYLRVNGEAYVETSALDILLDYYDGDKPRHQHRFKTEKSAVITMLRKSLEPRHYSYCKFLAFSADGLADTVSGTLEKLREFGYDTVPFIKIPAGSVPEEYEEFVEWVRPLLDELREAQGDIPADGVVLEIDDLLTDHEVTNQYRQRNIAIKLEHWSFAYYIGVVEEIIEEQKSVKCSYVARIKELVTQDRTTARRINIYSPAIFIEEGVKKGSKIYFARDSGAVNILKRGKQHTLDVKASVEDGFESFEDTSTESNSF